MKTIKNNKVTGITGKNIKIMGDKGEAKDARISDVVKILILNTKTDNMADVIVANKIWGIIDTNPESISLEDTEFAWLDKLIDTLSPRIFGVNALMISNAIKNVKTDKVEK